VRLESPDGKRFDRIVIDFPISQHRIRTACRHMEANGMLGAVSATDIPVFKTGAMRPDRRHAAKRLLA
jgi:hypothetical protein